MKQKMNWQIKKRKEKKRKEKKRKEKHAETMCKKGDAITDNSNAVVEILLLNKKRS